MPWWTRMRCCCTSGEEEPHKDGAFVATTSSATPTLSLDSSHEQENINNTTPSSARNVSPRSVVCNGGDAIASSSSSPSSSTTIKRRIKTPIPWVHSRRFEENYELGVVLGEGSFAVVHEAFRRYDPYNVDQTTINGNYHNYSNNNNHHHPQSYHQNSYAIKIVQRYNLSRPHLLAFKDEVQILADLQHENIIRLHEIYKDRYYFYVVLEKLDGGELFDRLCQKHSYCEEEARNLCRIMLEAVAYCHEQKVTHRDLKPENLLLKNTTDDTAIKIADFGFAKRVLRPNSLTTRCGSPAYTAPEIINYKPYDERVDNWSLGVIVYCILGGYPPFYASTGHKKELFQQVRQGAYTFHPQYWDGISPDAKKFISRLLTLDPKERMTSREALEHPWMTGRGDALLGQQTRPRRCLKANMERLKEYNQERRKPGTGNSTGGGPVKSADFYWLLSRR